MSTSESYFGRDYENSYDCDTDSDSECFPLVEKFHSLFGDNCFVKTKDNECQPTTHWPPMQEKDFILCLNLVDDYVKTQAESSSATSLANSHMLESQDMANKNMDDEARCRKKRRELDPYGEIWKKRALKLITSVRGNITNYNKGRAFFYINVAGYYGKAKDSGIGVLIRNRQGIPIAACSYYEANNLERVSPLFQELRAVSKSLDMADKLGLKYIHIICTSTDVSYAITSCDRGAPLEDGNHLVHHLSLEIIDKLQKRKDKYQKEDSEEGNVRPRIYFSNFAGGKIDNIAARYLARLKENEEEMGPEMLRKRDDLMDMIFKDANGLSDVALYYSE